MGPARKRDRQEFEQIFAADSEPLARRIDFQPARRPDVPVENASGIVRVLKPRNTSHEPESDSAGDTTYRPSMIETPDACTTAALPRSSYLFPPERMADMLGWRHMQGVGPGLSNLGNTCFMNATLQCLTYTAPFANLCLERTHSLRCPRRKAFCVYCELEGHVRAALDREHPVRSIAPRVLASRVRSVGKQFRSGQQEDAHEYFLCLVDAMQAAALRTAAEKCTGGSGGGTAAGSGRAALPSGRTAETSEVWQLFGGRLRSEVVCGVCGMPSMSYEPFMDLSLELYKAPSIHHALRRFTGAERLCGDNRYHCESCRKLVDASKRLQLHHTPPILTLQLKRFGFGRRGSGKLSRAVEFEEALDLSPYCTPECIAANGAHFRLYGVLVHEGPSLHAGHYYCHVRTASGVWHRCDDDVISQVSARSVLSEAAYMLFYQRVGRDEASSTVDGAEDARSASAVTPLPSAWGGPSTLAPPPELPSSSSSVSSSLSDEDEDDEDYEDEDEDDEDYEDEDEDEEPSAARCARPRRASFLAADAAMAGGEPAEARSTSAARRPLRRSAAAAMSTFKQARRVQSRRASLSIKRRRAGVLSCSRLCLSSVRHAWWRRAPSRSRSVARRVARATSVACAAATADSSGSQSAPADLGSPSADSDQQHSTIAFPPAGWAPPKVADRSHGKALAGRTVNGHGGAFGAFTGTWELDEDAAVTVHDGKDGRCALTGSEAPGRPSSSSMAAGGKRKRAYDYWDAELDRGHVRKTKAVREENRQRKLQAASGWLRGGGGSQMARNGGGRGGGKGKGNGRGKGKGKSGRGRDGRK